MTEKIKFARHTFDVYSRHISELNAKLGIDASRTRSVLELCRAICADDILFSKFESFRDRYFSGDYEHRDEIADCALRVGSNKYEYALALCEMYSLDTLELYRHLGIDDVRVYFDAVRDIQIWAEACLDKFGVYGIEKYGWVSYSLTGEIFRLGRLQFHTVPYAHEDVRVCGVSLARDSSVINVHIPAGEPLRMSDCLDSYRRAYEFFGLSNRAAFVCDSWLLYPAHREMLPVSSGIVRFADDYKIIEVTDCPAAEFGELWRVFGYKKNYAPDTLPCDSALRRAYIQRLRDASTLGSAFGVMIFDGQNSVREEEK